MRNTDLTITELVQGAAVLGAIGAGLGLVYYGYHRLTGQAAVDAVWWKYAVNGAAIAAFWLVAEWLFERFMDVIGWRASEHPMWKRVIAHLIVGVLVISLLLFPFLVNWLWGE
jgi:hypothetical protein